MTAGMALITYSILSVEAIPIVWLVLVSQSL